MKNQEHLENQSSISVLKVTSRKNLLKSFIMRDFLMVSIL